MSIEGKISIVIVDDHALVRDGIKSILANDSRLMVVAEAGGGQEAIDVIKKIKPNIAILDINMPKVSGIDAIQELSKLSIETRYIMLTMHDSKEYVLNSIKAGAHGYLLKDIEKDEFIRAIITVGHGQQYYSTDITNIVVNGYRDVIGKDTPPMSSNESQIITPKEKEIMKLALSGSSNKEIAEILGKSVRTVETHRFNLMKKLNAHNVAELFKRAQEHNLL